MTVWIASISVSAENLLLVSATSEVLLWFEDPNKQHGVLRLELVSSPQLHEK